MKKLVTILAISLSITVASIKAVQRLYHGFTKKAGCKLGYSLTNQAVDKSSFASKINSASLIPILECILYIYYLVHFQEDQVNIKTLIYSDSEINIMYLAYIKKIELSIQNIDIGVQKINSSALAIFDMMIAAFLINNKDKKIQFFKEIFLLANVSLDIIFEMFFFTLSNANVKFLKQKILLQAYIMAKTLHTTCQVEVIDWKKFAATILDKKKILCYAFDFCFLF